MTSVPYTAAAFEPGVSRAGYRPRRIVPPLSSSSRWSGMKSMTGLSVNMSNSVELASPVPMTSRANSMTAHWSPRHRPRYGIRCSRA